MKVRVYAREEGKVYVHGYRPIVGNPPKYINRDFVPGNGKDRPAEHPARAEPDEFDFGSPAGQHALREVKRGNLFAADRKTAELAGVEFTETEHIDGDWFVAKKSAPKKGKALGAGDERREFTPKD